MSDTTIRQLSLPAASEVASSEVSAIAEVKFTPRAAQVKSNFGASENTCACSSLAYFCYTLNLA